MALFGEAFFEEVVVWCCVFMFLAAGRCFALRKTSSGFDEERPRYIRSLGLLWVLISKCNQSASARIDEGRRSSRDHSNLKFHWIGTETWATTKFKMIWCIMELYSALAS